MACERCVVESELVRFGKRDVAYRDLPIHGERVTLWVVRRRYNCRACGQTFRPVLPPGRQQDAVTRRLMNMIDRHQVEIVSMDMWKPYRRAGQTVLPQAPIVVDKFHVVRMANDALEKVCKGLEGPEGKPAANTQGR